MTTRGPPVGAPATVGDPFQGATWQGLWQRLFGFINPLQQNGRWRPYVTVANLPTGSAVQEGDEWYATNGRKIGEAAGHGTGVPVYFSNGAWRRYSDDSAVAA